jgi:hypothetical protein
MGVVVVVDARDRVEWFELIAVLGAKPVGLAD